MAVNKDGFSRSLPEVCFPWKACNRQNRFRGSNPRLSAGRRRTRGKRAEAVCRLVDGI